MKLSAAFLATIATSHVTAQIKMLSKPKRSHLGILKNAKPYSSSHRRLEEEEDLAINATYSIQFSSCLDIKTYNPDLFDEDIITYVKSGKVVSTKSYVLFTACPDEEACDDTYIVDLSTYLSTVVEYKSADKENYCEACEEVEDACTDDDGGGRELSTQRQATEVTCDQCLAYGCYEDDNADDGAEEDRTEERVAEWIKDLSECGRFEGGQDDDVLWNGLELFYGAICNADGDGVEFVPFLDEDCTIYPRHLSFSNYYNATYEEEDGVWIDYATSAASYIEEVLADTMPCSGYEAIQYNDWYWYQDEEAQNLEVNEYCQQLFEESAASIDSCNATAENEDRDNADDDGYSWYTYSMTMESTDEIDVVCTYVKELNGVYYHAFKQTGGSSYIMSRNVNNEWDTLSSFEMSTIEICIFTVAMLAFAMCWCRRKFMKSKQGGLENYRIYSNDTNESG